MNDALADEPPVAPMRAQEGESESILFLFLDSHPL